MNIVRKMILEFNTSTEIREPLSIRDTNGRN